MAALNKAINTESRRIKREVAVKRAKKLSEVDFPEFKRVDLKEASGRSFYYFKLHVLIAGKDSSQVTACLPNNP